MKLRIFVSIFVLTIAGKAFAADQNVTQNLGVLDEKLTRLSAQVEALEFKQTKLEQDIQKLQADTAELRRTGGASPDDVKALEARIAAVDAAREKDKKAIIDQLAKELAGMGSGKPPGKSAGTAPVGDGKEYVVQKGDSLSSIAKAIGVTVAELRKANNLTSDSLKIGQKLTIPK